MPSVKKISAPPVVRGAPSSVNRACARAPQQVLYDTVHLHFTFFRRLTLLFFYMECCMKKMISAWAALLTAGLLANSAPALAQAQDYPSRPVKILIAFVPGGPSDIVGRLLAQKLTENFGDKPFIIENRPGAGGNIGIAQVAKSAPDGYTLLLVSSAFVINPSLYANAGFDAVKDFVPVSRAVTAPNVMLVWR